MFWKGYCHLWFLPNFVNPIFNSHFSKTNKKILCFNRIFLPHITSTGWNYTLTKAFRQMDWQRWTNIVATALSQFVSVYHSLIGIHQTEDTWHFNRLNWRAQRKDYGQSNQSQSRDVGKSLQKHKVTFKLQYAAQRIYVENFQLVKTLLVIDYLTQKSFKKNINFLPGWVSTFWAFIWDILYMRVPVYSASWWGCIVGCAAQYIHILLQTTSSNLSTKMYFVYFFEESSLQCRALS